MAELKTYVVVSSLPIVIVDGGTPVSFDPGQTFQEFDNNPSVIFNLEEGRIVPVGGTGSADAVGQVPIGASVAFGGGGGETLAQTLELGNETLDNDIVITTGRKISGGRICLGQSDQAAGDGDLSAHTTIGAGGFFYDASETMLTVGGKFNLGAATDAVDVGDLAAGTTATGGLFFDAGGGANGVLYMGLGTGQGLSLEPNANDPVKGPTPRLHGEDAAAGSDGTGGPITMCAGNGDGTGNVGWTWVFPGRAGAGFTSEAEASYIQGGDLHPDSVGAKSGASWVYAGFLQGGGTGYAHGGDVYLYGTNAADNSGSSHALNGGVTYIGCGNALGGGTQGIISFNQGQPASPVFLGSISAAGWTTSGSNLVPSATSEGFGLGVSVSGDACVVIGQNASCNSNSNTVVGYQALGGSSGNSTVIGNIASSTATGTTVVGRNASGGGASSVAVGDAAVTASTYAVAIGRGANGTGLGSIAIGEGAVTFQTGTIAIGDGASASQTDCLAIGRAANTTGFTSSMALGHQATPDASNQLVISSPSGLSDCVIGGRGPAFDAPGLDVLWRTTDVTSELGNADFAGAAITIQSGRGTGAGTASYVSFETPSTATSGIAQQTVAERLRIDESAATFTVPIVLNGLAQVERLSSTAGIDGTATGTTALFTVPTGTTYAITRAAVRVSSVATLTSVPDVGIGIAAGEDDIFASESLIGLDSTSKAWWFTAENLTAIATAGQTISLGVDTAAVAGTYTIEVDLFGYEV